MADVDIDPFGGGGEHDRTESRTDKTTGEDISLIPGKKEYQLWNQNMNEKHHSEGKFIQVYFTKNT